jgi:hypothetical protein
MQDTAPVMIASPRHAPRRRRRYVRFQGEAETYSCGELSGPVPLRAR